MKKDKVYAITHDGKFHSDEVFAVALLSLGYPNLKVFRTRDDEMIDTVKTDINIFVLDIGDEHNSKLRNFDHHQLEDSGVATFGLVFDYCINNGAKSLFDDVRAIHLFKKMIVDKIDHYDTNYNNVIYKARGIDVYTLQDVMTHLNTVNTDDEDKQTIRFDNAVSIARYIIQSAITHCCDIVKSEDRYIDSNKFDGVLVSKRYIKGWTKYAKPDNVYTHLYREGEFWKVTPRDERRFPLLSTVNDIKPDKLIKKFLAIFNDYNVALRYAKGISSAYRDVIPNVESITKV